MSPFWMIMAPLGCFRRNLSCMAAGDQGLQLLTKQRGILCLPWGFSFDFVCFCLLLLDLRWMILHMSLDYNKARIIENSIRTRHTAVTDYIMVTDALDYIGLIFGRPLQKCWPILVRVLGDLCITVGRPLHNCSATFACLLDDPTPPLPSNAIHSRSPW